MARDKRFIRIKRTSIPEQCHGCNVISFYFCLICRHRDRIRNNCPCMNCIVKPVCRTLCQVRLNYATKNIPINKRFNPGET